MRVPVERFRVARPLRAVAVVVVPVLGMYYSYRRTYFNIAAAIYGVALLFALAAYGRTLGGAAFGLLIALHAIGIAAYLDTMSPTISFHYRCARSLVLVAAMATIIGVGLGRVTSWFILPIEAKEGVLLINPLDHGRPLVPGEVMAYNLKGGYGGGIAIGGGIYLGQVLGGPGASVQFEPVFYVVNGVRHPSLPHMPKKGKVVAKSDQLLIWPTVFHFSYNPGAIILPETMALVPDSALVGRPYKRWFWHTQTP
ncbi:MAG: hypothetical protein RIQ79_1918 [Verrucomicrobiota bacterium]